ncbi:MAG: hypothetical protein MI919_07005 [Holophagales bacterium]|nr:hypothetical protein [Holophagales bacterium]
MTREPGDRSTESRQLGGRELEIGAAVFLTMAYLVVFLPRGMAHVLAGREMVYETIGALLFLCSSVFFFRCLRATQARDVESRRRRLAYLFLGMLLFVAFGEELSWGQHLIGYETPEKIKEINAQEEVNLHNLWWVDSYDREGGKKRGWRALLNSNRLFDYFMIFLFWVLPLAHGYLPFLARWIDRLGGPVVPGLLGWVLALDLALTVVTELLVVRGDAFLHLAVSETREMGYGLLTALAAYRLLARERGRAEGAAVASPTPDSGP